MENFIKKSIQCKSVENIEVLGGLRINSVSGNKSQILMQVQQKNITNLNLHFVSNLNLFTQIHIKLAINVKKLELTKSKRCT